ncbi:hypothetical protein TNCV_4994721 [Trichonephila clavipes]|nr:hypothetical protein TNCV_4994721 [Trichonephila clavipes]
METFEMLSKVYGECTMARFKVYKWHQGFKDGTESIKDNKSVGLPLTSRKANMLRWCLNVFEKIVAKHLHKSLRLHTSRGRCLMESIRCKWPHVWQSDDWYLLQNNASAHRSQLAKSSLPKPVLTYFHIHYIHQT